MGKHVKYAIKCVTFVLLTGFLVGMVNTCLKPKYYYNQMWPSTNTYLDFYNLDKNSVDVLFLGSSHAMCTFNPQIIYDTYGITSYNLASEQQSLVVSYYWLREALKYQTPKVVVLDTYTLYKFGANYVYNDMNCSEGSVRKAMDGMRPSPLKWEAARTIAQIDPTQSALSYLFLNIRYHARWSILNEDDFTEGSMIKHGGVKGFTTTGGTAPGAVFTPFTTADAADAEAESMFGTSQVYLDKITALCADKGIRLILTNIPCDSSPERYKATKTYADAHGLPYYDFNEASLYSTIAYDAAENLLSHPNYLGAEKVSRYLGAVLAGEYGIAARADASYDKSRAVYTHAVANITLTQITDPCEYLNSLQNSAYTIFIFAPKAFSSCISEGLMNQLFTLGFSTELREIPDSYHYCAVNGPDGLTEQLTMGDISLSGSIRGGVTPYRFLIDTSVMVPEGQTFSLTVDSTECGTQAPGLNLVVYDSDTKSIVDRVNINTTDPALPLTRY